MYTEDIEKWLFSLSESRRLEVFKSLSGYLSSSELKRVMFEVEGGKDLFAIHVTMGLIRKYQVDLLRIRRLLN